jgi:peptidoglycan/LPS O-acetylase OafA/YrhL
LFFVLSGFLISGILVNARHSPRYFSTFYARRAFRIFPLYYLVFFGYCIALAILGARTVSFGRLFENPLPVWPYALYLQNFAMAAASTYGPMWMAGSWSLAIEEQFYLTLPAIVRWVSDRTLAYLAFAGFVGPLFLRAAIQRYKFVPQLSSRVLLPTALDSLSAGILLMLLIRYRREWLAAHRKPIKWLACLSLLCWFAFPLAPSREGKIEFLNVTITSFACACALLYILIAPDGRVARMLSVRWVRLLGNMAYSTYLFHAIVLCVVFLIWKGVDPRLNTISDLPPLAMALIISLALSWTSWRFFEKPLIGAGHKFSY